MRRFVFPMERVLDLKRRLEKLAVNWRWPAPDSRPSRRAKAVELVERAELARGVADPHVRRPGRAGWWTRRQSGRLPPSGVLEQLERVRSQAAERGCGREAELEPRPQSSRSARSWRPTWKALSHPPPASSWDEWRAGVGRRPTKTGCPNSPSGPVLDGRPGGHPATPRPRSPEHREEHASSASRPSPWSCSRLSAGLSLWLATSRGQAETTAPTPRRSRRRRPARTPTRPPTRTRRRPRGPTTEAAGREPATGQGRPRRWRPSASAAEDRLDRRQAQVDPDLRTTCRASGTRWTR